MRGREDVLAERFARGEIDENEYRRRPIGAARSSVNRIRFHGVPAIYVLT
jgi:hypothetical protein